MTGKLTGAAAKRSETPCGYNCALCLSRLHVGDFGLKLRRVKLHHHLHRAETASQVSDWTLSGTQRHHVTGALLFVDWCCESAGSSFSRCTCKRGTDTGGSCAAVATQPDRHTLTHPPSLWSASHSRSRHCTLLPVSHHGVSSEPLPLSGLCLRCVTEMHIQFRVSTNPLLMIYRFC